MIDRIEQLSTKLLNFLFFSHNGIRYLIIVLIISGTILFLHFSKKFVLSKRKLFLFELGMISLLLFLSFFVRAFDLNDHPNGYYAFRQTQTLMVYRNYYEGSVDPLTTELDIIFQDQEEYEGYVDGFEFNLLPASTVLVSKLMGDTLYTYRLIIIAFSMLGSLSFYFVLKNYFSKFISLLGAFLYTLLPFNVYFGQAYMPDIPSQALFLAAVALAYFYTGIKKKWKKPIFIIASIVVSLAILMKPQSILFLPVFGIVISKDLVEGLFQKRLLSKDNFKNAFKIFLRSLAPFLILISFLIYERKIDDDYDYPHKLLDFSAIGNASLRGVLFDYVALYTLGLIGLTLVAIGLFYLVFKDYKSKKLNHLEIYTWLICTLLFYIIFFLGSVANTYYQINLIPISIILVLFAFQWLERNEAVIFIPVLAYLILNATYAHNSFWFLNTTDRPEVVEAGEYIQTISDKNDYVIVNDFVSMEPTALYFTHRKGWIADVKYYSSAQLNDNINKGAKYFITYPRFKEDLEKNNELYNALSQYESKDFGSFKVYYLSK